MAQARLLNPAGDLVGTLEGQPTPEAVLRLAYGLHQDDMMMSLLDGDSWHLGILVMHQRAAGEATRLLPFSIKVGAPGSQQADRHLMEMALLDLWDRGWSLEVPTDRPD